MSFVVAFSDETGEERSECDLDAFVDSLRESAARHGFDVQSWGDRPSMHRLLSMERMNAEPNPGPQHFIVDKSD